MFVVVHGKCVIYSTAFMFIDFCDKRRCFLMSQIKRTLDRNTPRRYECRVYTIWARTLHNTILVTQGSSFCLNLFYLLLFKQIVSQ